MPELQHKYLRPQDLRRLRNLIFTARRPVEGLYAGRHPSPQRGRSVEFTDYRPFTPGDEPSAIDWKVYGRSDKLFVKLFEHQTDMTLHLVVDGSASMGYAGVRGRAGRAESRVSDLGPDSKYDHACRLAAAIAFLTTARQDRVSFAVARDGLADFQRPQASPAHVIKILAAMERMKPAGEAHLAGALGELAARVKQRGLVIVFSDLLDDPEPVLKSLSLFTHRGGEAVLFHILHGDELKLPALEEAIFTDSETRGRLSLNIPDIRPAYEKRLRRFLDGWSAACRTRGFDYQLVNTSINYYRSLERYLFGRAGGAPAHRGAAPTTSPDGSTQALIDTLERIKKHRGTSPSARI